jgi:hypothetical protein
MANYHNLKNAAILTPTTNTDLGSDSNRYSNVFMSGNILKEKNKNGKLS